MKISFRQIAAVLFISSLSLIAPADNHSPCEVADGLVTAGELTDARKYYTVLLTATPTLECARNGLDKARIRELEAEALFRKSNDMLLRGERDEARIALLAALDVAPSRDDIRKQLGSLLGNQNEARQQRNDGVEIEDPYAVAKGLMAAGYDKEAKDKARDVWNEGVDEPIPSNLEANKFDRFATWASSIGINAGKIGSSFLALALVIWILILAFRKAWLQRPWAVPRHCQVVIEQIDDPRTDLKVGIDLRERLAAELSHASSPATQLTRVSQPGTTPIPQVEKLPSPISFLGPLLRWVQTPIQYHIAADVHSPVDNVATLSVSIHNGHGKLEARENFSMKIEEEERVSYLELGTLAGSWMVFELQRLRFPKSRAHELKVLGTTRWKSYGLFRRGERTALTERIIGHDGSDMKFFNEALAEDHNNIGALIVVGKLQSRNVKDEEEMAKGIEHLRRARRLLAKDSLAKADRCCPAIPETRIDPLWFQATYELAVAYLHRFASQENLDEISKKASGSSTRRAKENIPKDLTDGIHHAIELAKAIGATQLTLGSYWRRRSIPIAARRSLHLMLHQDAKYLLGILAGAKASLEWDDPCSLEQKRENAPPSLELDDQLWKWLSELDFGKLPSARSIADILENDLDSAGWATRYNLACFYSRARQADIAFEYLREYFEHLTGRRKKMKVYWVQRDPTLNPVRNEKKEEFDKLLALPEPPPVSPPSSTPIAPTVEWVIERFDGS